MKTPTLVDVVRRLGESRTVGDALSAAGVADAERSAYLSALETLASSGLIEER